MPKSRPYDSHPTVNVDHFRFVVTRLQHKYQLQTFSLFTIFISSPKQKTLESRRRRWDREVRSIRERRRMMVLVPERSLLVDLPRTPLRVRFPRFRAIFFLIDRDMIKSSVDCDFLLLFLRVRQKFSEKFWLWYLCERHFYACFWFSNAQWVFIQFICFFECLFSSS